MLSCRPWSEILSKPRSAFSMDGMTHFCRGLLVTRYGRGKRPTGRPTTDEACCGASENGEIDWEPAIFDSVVFKAGSGRAVEALPTLGRLLMR
jgi:hypothetical protein